MEDDYDLVVIGAGSGGVAAARRAAAHGARVAIIEADRVGGTCVIRGCVPKKLMMYAAGYRAAFAEAAAYGWNPVEPTFDLERWAQAKAREIDRLEGIYRNLLAQSGVELLAGRKPADPILINTWVARRSPPRAGWTSAGSVSERGTS